MHSLENPASTDRSSQVARTAPSRRATFASLFGLRHRRGAARHFLSGLKPAPPEIANDIAALRAHYTAFNDELRDRMLERFQVEIVQTEIGGIPVHRVTPLSPRDDSGRVLLNLHGGAFMWGSGSGALVESIPVAATSGLPVIAVDYRLAPEHTFPAASDDVQAVYEALLAARLPPPSGSMAVRRAAS